MNYCFYGNVITTNSILFLLLSEIICYRHKIAWLHHMTNLWLGRLCHMTAQPRLARAYLRQALTVSEKFALSIR